MTALISDQLCQFIENEEEFIKKEGNGDSQLVLLKLEKMHQRCQKYESSLNDSRNKYLASISSIQASLAVISKLETESIEETFYTLADQVLASAKIDKGSKTVFLWLGAGIMCEYSYDEAKKVLNENLVESKRLVEKVEKEMDGIKEKLTTVEVNIARVHNYNVGARKAGKS